MVNFSAPCFGGELRDPHARHTKHTKKSPTNRRSRADLAALPAHGFAAQSRQQMRGIPTAQTCRHEGSQTIDPTIQDPAAAAQRLSAAYPNRPGISRSEHAKPGRAPCVARRGWAVSQRRRSGCAFAHGHPRFRRSAQRPISWPERELKQALLPAAIGSRADMAYSDAASTKNEVSHSGLHRVDSDLAGAVQAALASTTDATIYIAHGSHAKPRIADARSTRHVVMPRSG